MGSRRLPGKVLADLSGKPLLGQLVERLNRRKMQGHLVVATTKKAEDDKIAEWAANMGLPCLRGSTNDLVKRFQQCVQRWPADIIVRVTADNPLTDPQMLDQLIEGMVESGADYGYFPTATTGTATDAVTAATLTKLDEQACSPKDREHLNGYILDNHEKFRIASFASPPNKTHPDARLTVDTEQDLENMRSLYSYYKGEPQLAEIIADFVAGTLKL